MFSSNFATTLALVASVFITVDAVPEDMFQAMTPITTKDCPIFKGEFTYTIKIDQEDVFTNNYSFDGRLFLNGSPAGSVSTGCQVSQYLSDEFDEPAGPCVSEIILAEGNSLLGVVTTSGTSIFGFKGPGSRMAITGGTVCALGAIGHIDLFSNKLVIHFA